jgi:hypothetical protein
MRVRRSLAAVCAIVALTVAAAGCSDPSGGTITARNGLRLAEAIENPAPGTCHRFVPLGVNAVDNHTGVDIRLHIGTDCTDPKGLGDFYLPSTLSATSVPGQPLWHSFSSVGRLPPVPAD